MLRNYNRINAYVRELYLVRARVASHLQNKQHFKHMQRFFTVKTLRFTPTLKFILSLTIGHMTNNHIRCGFRLHKVDTN
jgi:hypothetical protein